jgi:hypothetical protein
MNISRSCQTLTLAAVVTSLVALPTGTASASEARVQIHPAPASSVYAQPLTSLGGRTLAEYLSGHVAGILRIYP